MNLLFASMLALLLISCGAPQPKSISNVVPEDKATPILIVEQEPVEEVVAVPMIPHGAITANYVSGNDAFYGYVENNSPAQGATVIAFENDLAPKIVLNDTYGAELSFLRFPEFDRDLLLINARLKDPNFNKYYLYILKKNKWKLVVNGWAIHKSNDPNALDPIIVDPKKPDHMKRFYSVFDLDKESALGYTWRLLEESIPIENR